jgi:hypothetical protein
VDAWFDILTSSSGAELVVAVAEALLVELPVAALSLALARRARGEWPDRLPAGHWVP